MSRQQRAHTPRRLVAWAGVCVAALAVFAGVAAAHAGGLSNAQPRRLAVPTWLFLLTGGGVVGASFLLASFLTDRSFVERLHAARVDVVGDASWLRAGARVLGLAGLALVVVAGLFGPTRPLQNAAILLVWPAWWAGYTMTVYLVGNSWPAINPFRTLARPLAAPRVAYPERLGSWPAAVGLLALVWLEVVSPLAAQPRLLAAGVLGYLVVTVVGSALVGEDVWFDRVDPVSNVYALYGRVAPLQRTDGGWALALPGSGLVRDRPTDRSAVGLVVALVWGTTFDGAVETALWGDLATRVVRAGVPPAALYPLVLGAGYLVFLGVYRAAVHYVRPLTPTFRAEGALACAFAPSLVAIGAGYHLAHYLNYAVSLLPAVLEAVAAPLTPGAPTVFVLPGWFDLLPVVFVLAGHLLAVWVAHAVSFETFPSRLQAIRSQYPVTVAMVVYTMVSLWVVTRPYSPPPYI